MNILRMTECSPASSLGYRNPDWSPMVYDW